MMEKMQAAPWPNGAHGVTLSRHAGHTLIAAEPDGRRHCGRRCCAEMIFRDVLQRAAQQRETPQLPDGLGALEHDALTAVGT